VLPIRCRYPNPLGPSISPLLAILSYSQIRSAPSPPPSSCSHLSYIVVNPLSTALLSSLPGNGFPLVHPAFPRFDPISTLSSLMSFSVPDERLHPTCAFCSSYHCGLISPSGFSLRPANHQRTSSFFYQSQALILHLTKEVFKTWGLASHLANGPLLWKSSLRVPGYTGCAFDIYGTPVVHIPTHVSDSFLPFF